MECKIFWKTFVEKQLGKILEIVISMMYWRYGFFLIKFAITIL